MGNPIMNRYAISLDTDSVTELCDGNPDTTTALRAFATDAGVTFHNIVPIASTDTHFFGATQRFAFDAEPADVDTYCAYFDADREIVENLDA